MSDGSGISEGIKRARDETNWKISLMEDARNKVFITAKTT